MLSAVQRRFLDSRRVAHLATADAAAVPHVVPVCFAVEGASLYVTIDAKPKRGDPRALRRLRNLEARPVASLVADRYDDDWTRLAWVMVRGPVDILDSGAEHDRAQASLRARYPQYREMAIDALPVIALRIAVARGWGALASEGEG
ncbi:MAG: TIGR03668 family PPOX class F420-dependent oxidoreductase [Ectothiorhodospiraceae bacterium]|nr:TIGR03668 family PPOX class F420-dependent oxidoreductase [Chromatiales bacterium]MCP5153301.1 TIGR03668 family PPOX class F420-dependent oxidoreductase [Ectothiorhodospiraceae bacterium]